MAIKMRDVEGPVDVRGPEAESWYEVRYVGRYGPTVYLSEDYGAACAHMLPLLTRRAQPRLVRCYAFAQDQDRDNCREALHNKKLGEQEVACPMPPGMVMQPIGAQ